MAKADSGGKIRVIVFELEGSNETLQESLRTVAAAIGRPVSSVRLTPTATPNLLTSSGSNSVTYDDIPATTDPIEQLGMEVDSSTKAPKVKKNRPYKSPQVLSLDLNSGSVPFESYAEQKKPNTDIDKYLVIAAWLQEYAGISTINNDHVYTCYRRMRWSPPKDMGQAFRGGKADGLFSSPGRGTYTITHIGISRVEKMK